MIAIDTNVLARWILRDDEAQYPVAEKLLQEPCWIGWTVLLELAWLLKSYARLSRTEIVEVLNAVLALPTIHCESLSRVEWALERFRLGGDIADMIHIASAGNVSAFVSFEDKLAAKAGLDAPVPVELAQ